MISALMYKGNMVTRGSSWKENHSIDIYNRGHTKVWKALSKDSQKIIRNLDKLRFTRKMLIDSFIFNKRLIKIKEVYNVKVGYVLFKSITDKDFALMQVSGKTLKESEVGTDKYSNTYLPFLFTENYNLINSL